MIVYIDKDYKCHINDDGAMTAVETDFFDGKCVSFIEGYRFVPVGESWTRSDGIVFHGEMAVPFKDIQLLKAVQALYEQINSTTVSADRVIALEKENAALKEDTTMLIECVLELSEMVYV